MKAQGGRVAAGGTHAHTHVPFPSCASVILGERDVDKAGEEGEVSRVKIGGRASTVLARDAECPGRVKHEGGAHRKATSISGPLE